MTRKNFMMTLGGAAASSFLDPGAAKAEPAKSKIKRGVSFYSYQEEYYNHSMTLEDCFAEVASMGATGVQLIAEEMVPNYPDPPKEWVDQWFKLHEKYHTTPTSLDTFVDVYWGGRRNMSLQESVDTLVGQLKLAKLLGFYCMRPTTGPVPDAAPEMVERSLDAAAKYDVRIAPEIHSPIPLKGKYIDSYIGLIERSKTKHLGLTLDMGVFVNRPVRVAVARQIRDGVLREDLVRFIRTLHDSGASLEQARSELETRNPNPAEVRLLNSFYSTVAEQNIRDLPPVVPHIMNIHGKFYEMTEDLTEYSIPYDEVIPVLIAGGYDKSIDSEFEGQRSIQDVSETDSCEQIRRQHVMLRRLLGEV